MKIRLSQTFQGGRPASAGPGEAACFLSCQKSKKRILARERAAGVKMRSGRPRGQEPPNRLFKKYPLKPLNCVSNLEFLSLDVLICKMRIVVCTL